MGTKMSFLIQEMKLKCALGLVCLCFGFVLFSEVSADFFMCVSCRISSYSDCVQSLEHEEVRHLRT